MYGFEKILNKLWISLVAVGAVHAADVAPFNFDYLPDIHDTLQEEWDYLMQYKMFGAHGIEFNGQDVYVVDTTGWFGTADGPFTISGNVRHEVGGPVLIGGDLSFNDGYDAFTTGPVRVTGNVEAGVNFGSRSATENVFKGYQCVQGTVSPYYSKYIDVGNQFFGDPAYTEGCPKSVPQIRTRLRIPSFDDTDASYGPEVVAGASGLSYNAYIDIPPGKTMYDTLITKISIHGVNKVIVRMPPNGRLTRIFLKEGLWIENSGMIQIQYMQSDKDFDESTGKWSNTAPGKIVENKDYAGDLLFFTTEPLSFAARSVTDTMQGSYITTSSITIQQHMTLAGQLLADQIAINAEFDGSGFRYVPFDPPILKLPTAGDDNRHLVEGHALDTVKIELDKASKLKIDFEYCFEFTGVETDVTGGEASRADIATVGIPLYNSSLGKCETTAKGTFEAGETSMSKPITLTATPDEYTPEKTERFRIWIVNLSGATLEDGSHDGFIDLYIDDTDLLPPNFEKDTLHSVAENSPVSTKIDTLRALRGTEVCDGCTFAIIDMGGNPIENPYVKILDDSIVVVKDSIDFEKIETIEIRVRVTDKNLKQTDTTIYIPVINVNENPEITDTKTFTVPENVSDTVIGKITWDDLDLIPGFRIDVFTPIGGDTEYFTIDEDGNLKVIKPVDYEAGRTSYTLDVALSDKADPTLTVKKTLVIDIIDVNENPTLTKQDFHVNEHVPINTPVDTVKGGDLDSLIAYRDNVCFAFAGDKDLFTVDSNCVITTKKDLDYETMDSTFILVVKLRDRTDTNLFAIDTMTIHLHNINERPTILTDSLHVKENSPKGTDVGKLVATDPDKNDTKTFTLVSDPSGCFVVSSDGSVSVKADKCADLDHEKNKQIPIVVRVTDSGDSSHTKTIYVKIDNVPEPEIEITKAENTDTTWTKPDTLYTNQKHLDVCWEVNGMNETCADTSLKTGENRICKEVCNVEGFEGCARDCIIAYYSNVSPKVKISAATGSNLAGNIYTIVEQPAKGDTSVYVKDTVSKVSVMIIDNDPLKSKSDTTSFTIPVDLTKKISVPQTTYDALSNVAKQTIALDVAHEGTTHTPVNGSKVLVSYTEKVGGMNVEVSYVTDKNGNVVKQPVVNSKGKIDSVEVMTVSYQTVVGGDTVTVSYQADALTGKMLYADGNGSLSKHSDKSTGSFKISYDYVDKATGHSVELTYVVDSKGYMVKNSEGDRGYQVSFTYVDQYGNAAKKSVFVVLDQTLPVVKILSPEQGNVIRSNFVDVKWSINGVEQDTLTMQGLEKGANAIVRFYRDKAGNEASDTVTVVMKDSKEIEIAVEQPVTMVSADKVKEYYAKNPPKSGQTYAVSILNPSTGKEVETLIGGSFGNKSGSGKDPYKGSSKHLGPTLSLDLKLPTVDGLGGLATLDDLILSNGKISNKGIGIDTSKLDAKAKEGYAEYTVEEYVAQYCEDGTEVPSDVSKFNLYDSKLQIKLWVYTTLGNFVNYYTFTQELNDPSYTNEAALLQMFFEMKPDKDGYVHADNGKLLATGAYVYKVEAKLTNKLRCSIPPLDDNSATAKKKGDVIKTSDDLLKPFGYKRPKNK